MHAPQTLVHDDWFGSVCFLRFWTLLPAGSGVMWLAGLTIVSGNQNSGLCWEKWPCTQGPGLSLNSQVRRMGYSRGDKASFILEMPSHWVWRLWEVKVGHDYQA